MANLCGRVELLGLEGMTVTDRARKVLERAGCQVCVRMLQSFDLIHLKAGFGVDRLPVVRTEAHTFQGMNEIRRTFAQSSQ